MKGDKKMNYNRKKLINSKTAFGQMGETARKAFIVNGAKATPEQQKEMFIEMIYNNLNRRGRTKVIGYALDIMPLTKYKEPLSNKGKESKVFRKITQDNHKKLAKLNSIRLLYGI